MPKPIFYSGTKNASSWAMRAWLSLRAAEFDFDEEVVDIRRPQRFENLARMAQLSPSASVPALVTDEGTFFDSLAIMEFANEIASGALLPRSLQERAQARSIVAWQHAGLSGVCERISFESSFYPLKRRLTLHEHSESRRLFGFLEGVLSANSKPFLFGSISLADFALAPTVIRLSRHHSPSEAFPLTQQWMRTLLNHPLIAEWLSEADQLPHVWLDDYLLPGEPWNEATSGTAMGEPGNG